MTDLYIEEPQEGQVRLTLNWDEAEIVCRLLGLANKGNIDQHSVFIANVVDELVLKFGRNTATEARRYMAVADAGQVYLHELEPE